MPRDVTEMVPGDFIRLRDGRYEEIVSISPGVEPNKPPPRNWDVATASGQTVGMRDVCSYHKRDDLEVAVVRMGKDAAFAALQTRREENAKKEKIDNSRLYAGDPMYFYCRGCGALADTLPEDYMPAPGVPEKYCAECKPLKDQGWLE